MDAIEAIHSRRSVNRLVDPGPNEAEMAQLLSAAGAAPDHQKLAPWRFIVIQGDARTDLGQILVSALVSRAESKGTQLTAGQVAKERSKLNRAPTIIIAVGAPKPDAQVPRSEQLFAVAAAAQNILLTATAIGYGSMWRTGEVAYDPSVKKTLGIEDSEEIVGWLYIGTVPHSPVVSHQDKGMPPATYWQIDSK